LEQAAQRFDRRSQQWLATGEDHMPLVHVLVSKDRCRVLDEGLDRLSLAGRLPRRIRCVTEPAAQITTARADEETLLPGQFAFALATAESLTDEE
jgi:hypothetical protein